MQATAEKRWYLVQCKPKQGFRALEHLQHQGYECLLPTHEIERLRNGQWVRQEEALFPGYLFIELDTLQDNWMPIRSTRGVSQIVRFGPNPLPVPDHIIGHLRLRDQPLEHELQPGDRVVVDWSGTKSMEAIFIAKDGTERVLLLLNLLQREVQVSVSTRSFSKAD
ncbi:transcription/translation regulatory transformer protein RfaH [Pseudomonas nitroreducens]|uniref:transcription/translation regulatory transformer protein RfaH n=1 Tax=Pseudomonas nitroreducens TaxID=46680 RepID=UPI001475FE2A|nr:MULTISPECIES: transcription/translation regulatory transformer protein RfaH [Pseudomonas]MCJ1879733.1 transcription/translation regulatory transformer protein RfaH [Pseudomonas nitroreducens]MCJ1896894.1 transcription/translation regulatory transformer protein RfaH [Pseudomonas nitroreducens]MDG9857149.1 transcription/translation regulatory transformer protein RfaH [Pseudomonas nitroreducens]MDH1074312.1 transcription/translation regulatory transformer protein RfaH [Pseudomonas nitroreducens